MKVMLEATTTCSSHFHEEVISEMENTIALMTSQTRQVTKKKSSITTNKWRREEVRCSNCIVSTGE